MDINRHDVGISANSHAYSYRVSESQNASVSSNAGDIVELPAPRLVQSADRRTALIYLGLLDDAVAEWVAGISEAVTAETDNRKRVIAAIKYYFDKVDDTDRSYRLIFETDFTADPDVRARVEDVVSQAARIVGVEISQQTNLSSGEANILAAGLCGMAQAAAWRWIKLGRPVTKEQAIRGVTYLGWEGLSTLPS